jgi:NADH dehydrogenase [ubiquinone] 1 alpha subcomplex assembly factor 7
MSPLTPILRDKILAEGPVSLAEYMALALGHPEHGYYMTRDPFGARGDFITAPEISQIFGEMIGIWCATVWRQLGGGPISLVELGPGRGTLMADILRATKSTAGFHDAITIHMVETSPVLANAQYMRLRYEHPRIEWLDSIEEVPENKMLLIANEFFDALPIKQHVMTEEGIRERRIGWNAERETFEFVLGEPGLALAKSGGKIASGTVMESSPPARGIMRQIAQRITEHGGGALVIDYGYLGEAHQDTLQAVKSHLFHQVLIDPGTADITAHVDFTSLMHIATDAGATVHGLATQGEFLRRMGAELRLEMLLKQAIGEQREQLISGLTRLISPQAMGELFKVMAVISDPRVDVPGFVG